MFVYVCCVYTDIDDLFEVQSEVHNVAHKWKGLGKALRLRPAVLNRIEASRPDIDSRLEEALTEWLQKAYNTERFGLPSWKMLVAANLLYNVYHPHRHTHTWDGKSSSKHTFSKK